MDDESPWRYLINDRLLDIIKCNQDLTVDETAQLAEYMRTRGLEVEHGSADFYYSTIRPI